MKKSNYRVNHIRKEKKKRTRKRLIIMGTLAALIICGTVVTTQIVGGVALEDGIVVQENPIKRQLEDTDLVSGSNVTYEGKRHAIDVNVVADMLKGNYTGEEKYVFLTFDDGPSPNTEKVLNVLKEKDVKGTFFVLGQRLEDERSKNTLKRTLKEGHAIANHSYTHNFKKLYPGNRINIEAFMNEFDQTNNAMKEILGSEFNSNVLRMPGGYNSREFYKDASLPAFNEKLSERGIVSIDWNALNGDAEGKPYSTEEMMNYVKRSTNNKNHVVILMHDTFGKEKTAEMLPQIIDYYKSEGYEFKTMM
ncbi:MAG: polysaccharide deacetylase family protein [Clostridium sp.]